LDGEEVCRREKGFALRVADDLACVLGSGSTGSGEYCYNAE
jgi:hypothetical protein